MKLKFNYVPPLNSVDFIGNIKSIRIVKIKSPISQISQKAVEEAGKEI